MELQEKHRVTLLNAKCEVVCKIQSLLKKMEYGEDVSCCTNNVWLAIKLINRLECYCFDSTTENKTITQSVFSVNNQTIKDTFPFIPAGSSIKIVIDEIVKSHITVDEETNVIPGLVAVLENGLFDYESTLLVTSMSLPCDTESASVIYVVDGDEYPFSFSLTTEGVCEVVTTECHNCIEDSDLNKMYEVLANLLK